MNEKQLQDEFVIERLLATPSQTKTGIWSHAVSDRFRGTRDRAPPQRPAAAQEGAEVTTFVSNLDNPCIVGSGDNFRRFLAQAPQLKHGLNDEAKAYIVLEENATVRSQLLISIHERSVSPLIVIPAKHPGPVGAQEVAVEGAAPLNYKVYRLAAASAKARAEAQKVLSSRMAQAAKMANPKILAAHGH